MGKVSLTKSIEAKRLNKRTGAPTTDPEVTIPFGAIIDNIEADRDMQRFTYQGDLYRCPSDLLASALDSGLAEQPAPSGGPASAAAQPNQPRLQWMRLNSSQHEFLRAKVPGGWLITPGTGAGVAFYPDPGHEWDGASLE
ncbi:MAG TPA: hypothetical protein VG675_03900 [Bryobacteraceae bacterium]|nr:hypothetical protein [Bryobacteraceae bacterium]